MENQLESLISLAALDREIGGLRRKLDEIPKAIEDRRGKYLDAQQGLEGAKDNLTAMQKEHRQAEGALDGHLDKIRKFNDQTSMVKTNKEYQALLVEIENLKKEQGNYEERILELMEQTVEVEGRIRSVKQTVEEEKKSFGAEEARLLAEADGLKGELEKLEASRAEILPTIEAENLLTYTKVKGLRGDAVAEVRNELCLGCRVTLPPQMYADVMMASGIQTCAHCQRILYFRKKTGESTETE